MIPSFLKGADKHYLYGIVLVAVSALFFSLPALLASDAGTFGVFLLNYAAVVVYAGTLFWGKRWKNIPVLLVLFLISAYALNRDLTVFEHSTQWLACALVLYSINLLLLPLFDNMPGWVRHIMSLLMGASLLLFLYLAAYVMQLYLFSIPAAILFGISLHSFVPLLIVIYLVRKMVRIVSADKVYVWSILAGVAVCIGATVVFTMKWQQIGRQVDRAYQQSLIADKADLPEWVRVAQQLPANKMTEDYLKGDLVFTTYNKGTFSFGWNMPEKNFDEPRKHDPLILLAGMFGRSNPIPDEERIKILEAIYISGHQTQDRYWSGENLVTSKVISNVRIWPHQRLAYTEKTITVQNNGQTGRWNQEEAIYTFHLPEGGIVTSLSLWIDGKEQKGILTTRGKADSAYKQIVGVEQRDPSVVHWQEGNAVTVRVFPVVGGSSRIFKVGITAPLTYNKGMLRYDNIWFEGPNSEYATELQQIHWANTDANPPMDGFTKNAAHRYERECNYQEEWNLTFKDPGFKPDVFVFNGQPYMLQAYEKQRLPATINTVYLDINEEWSKEEVEKVMGMLKGKKVYVYDESMVQAEAGSEEVKRLLKVRFSLFPYHLVADPATSLVITKGTRYSPSLKALRGFSFADELAQQINKPHPVRLFNMGKELSLYQRTLKEHRVFDYEQGDVELLNKLIATNTFAHSIENDSTVTIDNAMIMLTRKNDTVVKNGGTDHIMRLFAYNHIMLGLKGNLFPDRYSDSAFVAEAEQAYVVTPVSSLVVLEKQEDYDRFGIKKSMNTLDNATLKSNGAVPEPHEWALIILAAAALLWAYYHKRTAKA